MPNVFLKPNDKCWPFYESILLSLDRNRANQLECTINLFQFSDGSVLIWRSDEDLELKITNENCFKNLKIRRASLCPFAMLNTHPQLYPKPPSLSTPPSPECGQPGIPVAAVVLLHCLEDDTLLLTRRPKSMRSFPLVWVPPGGTLNPHENWKDAALRELAEETGIELTQSRVSSIAPVCCWESGFPPFVAPGKLPKRHHLVIYLAVSVRAHSSQMHTNCATSSSSSNQIGAKFSAEEVDAFAWLNVRQLVKIAASFENLRELDEADQLAWSRLIAQHKLDCENDEDDDDKFECFHVRDCGGNDGGEREGEMSELRPIQSLCTSLMDLNDATGNDLLEKVRHSRYRADNNEEMAVLMQAIASLFEKMPIVERVSGGTKFALIQWLLRRREETSTQSSPSQQQEALI